MKKALLLLFIINLSIIQCYSKHLYKEEVYQEYWCKQHNGIMEFQLDDKTRIDCLTQQYAVEVDFANKWAECIGQSLYYGLRTNKCPACLLIMEKGVKDEKYLKRLRYVANKKGIDIFTITPDKIDEACFYNK